MNVRQAVIGGVATASGRNSVDVDIGALVRRLILFDRVIVKSLWLREVPTLVRTFQQTGFTQLIDSGLLGFSCGSTALIVDTERGGIRDLPPNHYSFGIASAANLESTLKRELGALQSVPGLKNPDRTALEDAVWKSLIPEPVNYGQDLLNQFDSDIRGNTPALKFAILQSLGPHLGGRVSPASDVSVQVEETRHRVFHIKTKLGPDEFPPEKVHAVLKSSLLAVSSLDQRLADMQVHSAITGFRDSEAPSAIREAVRHCCATEPQEGRGAVRAGHRGCRDT